MKNLLLIVSFLFSCLLCHAETVNQIPPPPEELPIKVNTGFRLVRLLSINEKEQTFKANVYFSFKWLDPRLAFTSQSNEQAKVYLEDAVTDKFKEIWWPQLEYKNTDKPVFNNQTLLILPDGKVEYYVGLTADFRFPADFRRFPYDSQVLPVLVDSFIWSDNFVVFVPASTNIATAEEVDPTDVQKIMSISESTITVSEPELRPLNGSGNYSMYDVTIAVTRDYNFYLYQIFLPLIILLLICYPMYFDLQAPFIQKLLVNVTCFLTLVATKFAVAIDLPHIGYLTILDKIFLLAYLVVGLSVLITFINMKMESKHPIFVQKINRYVPLAVSLLFIASFAFIYFFS